MIHLGYTITAAADRFVVEWSHVPLTHTARIAGVLLTAGAALLWVKGKNRMSRIGAGAALAATALLFFLSFQRPPEVSWRMTDGGLWIKSLQGELKLSWADLRSARLEAGGEDPAKASLVLTDKDGRDAWLVLSWLVPAHRAQTLERIAAWAPEAMAPVLQNGPYMAALKGTSSAPGTPPPPGVNDAP